MIRSLVESYLFGTLLSQNLTGVQSSPRKITSSAQHRLAIDPNFCDVRGNHKLKTDGKPKVPDDRLWRHKRHVIQPVWEPRTSAVNWHFLDVMMVSQ
jgi:hypothetical protein